ncbi:MAG: enoyl-CoA hydratase-related protein [Granulosicoccus sp.]
MSYLSIQTDDRGVTTITFDHVQTFNAMNREFMEELTISLEELPGNTRIVVLAANGKHFCAGADINWMKQSAKLTDKENQADAMALSNMLQRLNTINYPTIAKVHGAALGGGTGVVCCCDIVVASEDARFAFSEVKLGIIPATISPYALAAIGARAARRYFLTGEKIDAVEAYRIGLIHDVCSADNLNNRVEEKITSLLSGAPLAQSAAKILIGDVSGAEVNDTLREQLASRLATIRTGNEAQEGLGAFLEKRIPEWNK